MLDFFVKGLQEMERKIWLYTDAVLDLRAGAYVPPVTCEIDPSNRCMLNCNFCLYAAFREAEGEDLDFDLYKRLLEELRAEGVGSITFTGGGEPLMHEQISEMIDLAHKRGFDLGLVTNGVLLHTLDEYIIDTFKFIRVSLDAADADTYLAVKGANSFRRVIKTVERIAETKGPSTTLGLSYVICKKNQDQIADAKKLSKDLGVDYIQFKPAWLAGKLYDMQDLEASDAVFVTERYEADSNLPCLIAGLIGIVSANGKLYYCCQHRGKKHYELGDLREHSFHEVWQRRKVIKPTLEECPKCRYMNYARRFTDIPKMLIEHRRFL